MVQCKTCDSVNLTKNGKMVKSDGKSYQKYKCKDCGSGTNILIDESRKSKLEEINRKFSDSHIVRKSRYVVTCAQNDTDIDSNFFDSLKTFVEVTDSSLIVIPVRYMNPSAFSRPVHNTWDSRITKYLMDTTMEFDRFKIIGDLKIQPTAQSPLTGLEPVSQGKLTVVGHCQIQLKSLPRLQGDPVFLSTTGSLTKPDFSDSRAGYIAEFHHSIGAVVIDEGLDGRVYIRHLVADDDGSFIDMGYKYSGTGVVKAVTKALVLGDEHVGYGDQGALNATFADGGLVDTLKPEILVRHDIFDGYSISHHHENNFFRMYKKVFNNENLESELIRCYHYLKMTTPRYAKSIIVSSNHNCHLMRWLQEPRSNFDLKNAKINFKLKSLVLEAIENYETNIDAFTLWLKDQISKSDVKNIEILDGAFSIEGVEISLHGDKGPNGARGSAKNISKLPKKTVIGHSHTPCIERGCYQVGTMTGFDLEYCSGPTSWANSHCAIYENGKRQLITIVRGHLFLPLNKRNSEVRSNEANP